MYQVVKRNGAVVDFDISKISVAIKKAFDAIEKNYTDDVIDLIALRVTSPSATYCTAVSAKSCAT